MDIRALYTSNALLNKEARRTVRDARTFILLGLFLVILSAAAAYQFPQTATIAVGNRAVEGQALFGTLAGGQALLIIAIFPALAAGSYTREREQGTVEQLLLTPMSAVQIVYGKAGGMFILAALLLLSTLPLASMSFLLGGVSPGDIALAYAGLFLVASVVVASALSQAASGKSMLPATLYSYWVVPVMYYFFYLWQSLSRGPGPRTSWGLLLGPIAVSTAVRGASEYSGRLWKAWMCAGEGKLVLMTFWVVLASVAWAMACQMGFSWISPLHGALPVLIFIGIWAFIVVTRARAASKAASSAIPADPFSALFSTSIPTWRKVWIYALFLLWWAAFLKSRDLFMWQPGLVSVVMQWGEYVCILWLYFSTIDQAVRSCATALMHNQRRDPQPSARKRLYDSPARLVPASEPVFNRASTGFPNSVHTPYILVPLVPEPSYGVKPFLADSRNPIFAKEMRSGFIPLTNNPRRFAYAGATGLAFALLCWVLLASGTRKFEILKVYDVFSQTHLFVLMSVASLFGSRSIAPEREWGTFSHLATLPLDSGTIIGGKMMAVLAYAGYIFVTSIPLALYLYLVQIVSGYAALGFIAVELPCGAVAAAWGVYCSVRCQNSQNALGWALGGVLALGLVGHFLPVLIGVPYGAMSADPVLINSLVPYWSLHCAAMLSPAMPGLWLDSGGNIAAMLGCTWALYAMAAAALYLRSVSEFELERRPR